MKPSGTPLKYYLQRIVLLFAILSQTFSFIKSEEENNNFVKSVYSNLVKTNQALPKEDVFEKAMKGFFRLRREGEIKKNIITVIDFRLSSNKKRMWVIDLDHQKTVFHSLVAHGRNTGNEFAKNFGNIPQSYKSSLGFYITGDTYQGKHGLSLYLDGMEKGINDNAKDRAIVMHGANYVSKDFIRKYGRLGRSYGCPSIPMKSHKEIITTIQGKSCLFIYFPEPKYISTSTLIETSDL